MGPLDYEPACETAGTRRRCAVGRVLLCAGVGGLILAHPRFVLPAIQKLYRNNSLSRDVTAAAYSVVPLAMVLFFIGAMIGSWVFRRGARSGLLWLFLSVAALLWIAYLFLQWVWIIVIVNANK